MSRTPLPAVLAAALLLGSCARRVGPSALLEDAGPAADSGQGDARTLALAGFHAYLLRSDPALAQRTFDAAVKADPKDPYALFGQILMARRSARPTTALTAALDLCERAPTHPLAAAAARLVHDLGGTATSLDELILQRAPRALAAGVSGDGAQLLRGAISLIQSVRGDEAGQGQTLAAMGIPSRYSVLGPFSAYHVLSFDEPFPPEKTGAMTAQSGPYGPVAVRQLAFSDGQFSLAGEPPQGDTYFLGVDVKVPAPGDYVVRTVSSSTHRVYLDGQDLMSRRVYLRVEPTISVRQVRLEPGAHRVLVKLQKEDRTGALSLAILRADGQPSQLQFSPAEGAAPRWNQTVPSSAPASFYPDAQALEAALSPEVGSTLAQYLSIRDAMGRDRDGAKRLMRSLEQHLKGPALTSLRADLLVYDRTLPTKVARGRATRDLEVTTEKDPGDVQALLTRATLAMDDGRNVEAGEFIKAAKATSPTSPTVLLAQARLELALGVDAQADRTAEDALKLQPGFCEASGLRLDLAVRRDAISRSDELLKLLENCPGARGRAAEHARTRGKLDAAISAYERMLAREPGNVNAGTNLASLLAAQRKFDQATKVVTGMRVLWPRNAALVKRLADLEELAGNKTRANQLRAEALSLEGADLALRRQVERARTGRELLEEFAVNGKKAIARYEANKGQEDASASFVLDAAAVRAYPDGSMVDRIHVIQKVLDQSAVQEVAEISIPAGAHVLALRTIKASGTVLEPESIEGKETISLPGVQVGDYVEYEYLLAHPSRGPSQPGFTATNFYFQIARQPNNWATYVVAAPKGSGLRVDGHQLKVAAPTVSGDEEIFRHEEVRVPPFIPEPDSPPSGNEFLPFVSVGAGSTGNEGLISLYADAFLDRGQLTSEVEWFAKEATAGKTGRAAVEALHSAVMTKLTGRDGGLVQSASGSLAQDRGSRLWALKAGLESIGIRARVAMVRSFGSDPAPYIFPNEALLSYVCLRAELPEGGELWLDTSVRFGPFGELPEQARGGREAWLLPEPGRPLEKVRTPPSKLTERKEVRLTLSLEENGQLTGEGSETYNGFDAASIAEALEAMPPDQRTQAIQSALSRYFGGAELSRLDVDLKRAVGAPLVVSYAFKAPRFARVEGKRMMLGAITFPAYLGRRYTEVGARRTPLYIDSSEASHSIVTLQLPKGFKLTSPPVPNVKLSNRYGSFDRTEKLEGKSLRVEESYQVNMARVAPTEYEAFSQFAGEVDLVQARDLMLEP